METKTILSNENYIKLNPFIMTCMDEIYKNCIDKNNNNVNFADVFNGLRKPSEFYIESYKLSNIIEHHCESIAIPNELKNLFRLMCTFNNFSPCFSKALWNKTNKK